MDPLPEEPRSGRWLPTVAFVASAALAAGTLRFAWHQPLLAAAGVAVFLAFVASRWLAQRRLRRLLRSGNVQSVLQRWAPSFSRIPNPATMAPLMTATAFAAYGWVGQARSAMAAAARGPAWDAALEHRLFLDAILLTFEGDRDGALLQASRLERLPLPASGGQIRDRVVLLRVAVAALARAFAHRSEPGDRERLTLASEASPLIFWAMRYAAAVIAVDQGDRDQAMALLAAAPAWPAESIFRAFHDEIVGQLAA